MHSFSGRSAVITGGSRGLGLTLARQLVREGARVTILARSPAELLTAQQELEAEGGDVLALRCDVTDRDDVESVITAIEVTRGGIDLLINNAGVIQVGPVEQMSAIDFEEAMATHFWGPLHAMRAAIPGMKRRGGGRIVNISSIAGKIAVPHLAPYCASKFALTGLSDAMRAELSRHGIRITTVCPGLMRTGSHVNIDVKGDHRSEFAWFAAGAGAPLMSVSAERAAREILRAAARGRRELVIGAPWRILTAVAGVVPSLVARAMALVARVLPKPSPAGFRTLDGWASRSRAAPSLLTRRADREVERHNELRGHSPLELKP